MKITHIWKCYYPIPAKFTTNIVKIVIKVFKNLQCRRTNKSKVTIVEKKL